MEVKTEAIVLQALDYKDNDKILILFSPTLGKITAGIKGVKKPKAKLAFASQPFCFAEYVLAEKGGRYTVTSAYLHESFFDLRLNIDGFYAGCAMAEVCRKLSLENERYESLFIAFIEGLKGLCLTQDDFGETLISFLLIALLESGYPIHLGLLEECGGDIGEKLYFDFTDGQFNTFANPTGERASLSTYHVLRKCAGLSYDEKQTTGGAKRALRLLKRYISEKTEEIFENLSEFIRMYEA